LAHDEILSYKLKLKLLDNQKEEKIKIPIINERNRYFELIENLPFKLTNDQKKVIDEIYNDQKSNHIMFRLLQGDVGSGKTLVALCVALNAIESGYQVILMAPTELLAIQHKKWIDSVCNLRNDILLGKIKGKKREAVLQKFKNHEIDIAFGTHALFQDGVEFANLGLVIIDEQQRFGVAQRAQLAGKSNRGVDVLLMSATPIPRTLSMVLYDKIKISYLYSKPIGRAKIKTTLMKLSDNNINKIIESLKNNNEKVYWVCPLIERSENFDCTSATERYNLIVSKFQDDSAIGLLHGKMSSDDKDAIMMDFYHGIKRILVATTVVEVGIDVPDATIIIIENADRFGLSQLHQLRGRVGRQASEKPCHCLLLYGNEEATKRLKIMMQNDDGFKIAEYDLSLRGAGNIAGTEQSGNMIFRFFNYSEHGHLYDMVNDEIENISDIEKYKTLLEVFNYHRDLS